MIVFFIAIGLRIVYPNKYDQVISEQCDRYNIDTSLVKGVVWTESKFKSDAVSTQGAVGLMQVLPSTAKWIISVRDLDIDSDEINLKDPNINIMIGVAYMDYLIEKFIVVDTALAAYNAGPSNVIAWLQDSRYSLDNKTLKSTPYEETNNYIKRVNKAKRAYEWLP